jgi:hypothetical protein
MNETLTARDIYMRHTDKDGRSYVQEHRVWAAARFVESQRVAAAKVNGSAQQVTREIYLQEGKIK